MNLINLSNHLRMRYRRKGKLEDLVQSIECSQEAVDLTPAHNPDRAEYINNLSINLSKRYKR